MIHGWCFCFEIKTFQIKCQNNNSVGYMHTCTITSVYVSLTCAIVLYKCSRGDIFCCCGCRSCSSSSFEVCLCEHILVLPCQILQSQCYGNVVASSENISTLLWIQLNDALIIIMETFQILFLARDFQLSWTTVYWANSIFRVWINLYDTVNEVHSISRFILVSTDDMR